MLTEAMSSLGHSCGWTQPSWYFTGNGKGVCVKYNAASVWNRSDKTVRVYSNCGYAGAFGPGAKVNPNATLKGQNASHQLLTGPPATNCKTDGRSANCDQHRGPSGEHGKVERVAFKTYVKNVLPNEWIISWPAGSLDPVRWP